MTVSMTGTTASDHQASSSSESMRGASLSEDARIITDLFMF